MSPGRLLFGVGLAALVVLLGYRVVEAADAADPADHDASSTSVQQRLREDPLDGDAFSDLAVDTRTIDDPEATLALHAIAARRDPRDLRIRGWIAQHRFAAGEYPEALAHLDVMLRLSPDLRKTLPPLMAQWADEPAFAEALADLLSRRPIWMGAMMAAMSKEVARPGPTAVVAALRESGTLDDADGARWVDALIRAGQWHQAHRFWTTGLGVEPGSPLPVPYNGNFEQAPSQRGFDWRTGRRSGSYTEFEPVEGAMGRAAHVVFLGRPVEFADLEQPLALAPGHYRLSMRARAVALRSDQGLRWRLACNGASRQVADSERLQGSFEWRQIEIPVEIPTEGCPGQWLRLVNPAPKGSARMVAGELWFDDMSIVRSQPRVAFINHREP